MAKAKRRSDQKLNTLDCVFLAQTTPMTIYNWRKGATRKTRPLPCDISANHEVSFSPKAFADWCEENGIELMMDPKDYLEARAKYERRKPGPKPTTKPVEDAPKRSSKKALTNKQAIAKGLVKQESVPLLEAAVRPVKRVLKGAEERANKARNQAAEIKSRASSKPKARR